MNEHCQQAATLIAKAIDLAMITFLETIEGRVPSNEECARCARKIHLWDDSFKPNNRQFFIWRNLWVLELCVKFLETEIIFTSRPVAPDDWPPALRTYIEARNAR